MIRRPPRSTPLYSSAASDVYKRQRITLPPPTSLVLAGRSGFCGSVLKALMMPPPPPAVGVVEGVVLPPQAESTRARDAAPAAAVTQRARTELPRIDPPRDF